MEEQDQEEQTGSNQLSDNDGAAGILSQDELAINDNNNTKKVQGYSQGHLQRDETTLAVEPSSIVKEMSDIDGINGSTTDKLCNETIIREDGSASNECDDSLAKVKLQLYETTPKHSDTESEYCDCKSMVSIDSKLEAAGNETFNDSLVDKAKSYSSSLSQSLKTPSCSSIHTFAQSTQSTLVDFCRICHCEGDAEVGPLIAPCYCRGSLRYVHQNCLQQWIKSSDSKHCELCGYHFVMDSKLKPFLKWKKLSMSTNERRKIMCSVMFHIIAITCVIWSLYVLIDKTTEEINNGNLQWPFWTKLVVVAIGFTGGLVFMYVQCKVYVQLWKRLKAFNRVIYVKNNSIKDGNTEDEGATDADSIGSNIEPRNTHSTSNSQGSTGGDGVVVIEICNQNSQL